MNRQLETSGIERQSLVHLPALDGLRGMAALMVMIFHFSFIGDSKIIKLLETFKVFGQTGVDLFFVLSGFLITRILISTKENKDYFSIFYIRRSLRIFPLYFVFLAFYYFILPVILNIDFTSFKEQFWYWVYLQNIPMTFGGFQFEGPEHFWSLAVEEHFYLVWPFLVFFISNRYLMSVSVTLIFVSIIARFVLVNNHYNVFYFTLTRLDSLSIGTILAILEIREGGLLNYKRLFGIILLFVGSILILFWFMVGGARLDLIQVVKFTLIALCYFSLIGFIIVGTKKNILNMFLELKFLKFSGRISYGLYVFHPLIFMLSGKFFHVELILRLLLSFGMTYCVASVSFFFFEQKILKFKRFFEYQQK